MKLLLIGAGYVGMALLAYLQSQPHEICITTTRPERMAPLAQGGQQVVFLPGISEQDFKALLDSCDGAIVLVAPTPPHTYEETYLGTANKITAALKDRQKPFYLLYTSSTSVCEGGSGSGAAQVTEDMPLSPSSENGQILWRTEQLYLQCAASTCILRLGGIYGPNRELCARARRFSGKQMPGTGDEPTNHIHLEDIIGAIAFCLTQALTGIYHVVNDAHPSRRELYSALCRTLAIPPPSWGAKPSTHTPRGQQISNQKLKNTGFVFKHPLISEY